MKQVLIFTLIILSISANAQTKYYKDSVSNQQFNLLVGATSINNGLCWDNPNYTIPIGFNFHFFQDSTTNLYMSSDIGLGSLLTIKPVNFSTNYASCISTIGTDLVDRDTSCISSFSPISYITTGSSPNRILKIQWKNAGFLPAILNGHYTDSINFQLWLYEKNDQIDVRFGSMNLVSPLNELYNEGPGLGVAIFDSLDLNAAIATITKGYIYKGNATSPSIDSSNQIFDTNLDPITMIGNPDSSMVYSFIPKKTATSLGMSETIFSKNIYIYPNPSTSEFYVKGINGKVSFEIIDIVGQTVKSIKLNNVVNLAVLPISEIINGNYFIKIVEDGKPIVYKSITIKK